MQDDYLTDSSNWFLSGKRCPSREDGEPCDHPECLNHTTHPCEGCVRIAGVTICQNGGTKK